MNDEPQSLQINTSSEGGKTVVHVRGDVDMHSSPQLRDGLLSLATQLDNELLIDLGGVSYMDSSGVGTMVFVKRQVERDGGRMVLIGLRARVRSVLEITRLEKFFTIVKRVDEVSDG